MHMGCRQSQLPVAPPTAPSSSPCSPPSAPACTSSPNLTPPPALPALLGSALNAGASSSCCCGCCPAAPAAHGQHVSATSAWDCRRSQPSAYHQPLKPSARPSKAGPTCGLAAQALLPVARLVPVLAARLVPIIIIAVNVAGPAGAGVGRYPRMGLHAPIGSLYDQSVEYRFGAVLQMKGSRAWSHLPAAQQPTWRPWSA